MKKFHGTRELKQTGPTPQLTSSLDLLNSTWLYSCPIQFGPRCYPEGFGLQLLKVYEGRGPTEAPLRFKTKIDACKSDRQIFQEMPLGDPWIDSKLHLAWAYLYRCKYLRIPDSWAAAIKEFDQDLSSTVSWQLRYFCDWNVQLKSSYIDAACCAAKVTISEDDRRALNELIAECNAK